MIAAGIIAEELKNENIFFGSGVPCSILTPLLNEFLIDDEIDYVGAANEAHAVGIASGADMAGKGSFVIMQNSGFCNIIEPMTSLNAIFRVPLLLIISWRGDPTMTDAHHHGLAGEILPRLLDMMEIPWEILSKDSEIARAMVKNSAQKVKRERKSHAIIIRSDTLGATLQTPSQTAELEVGRLEVFPQENKLPARIEILDTISRLRTDTDFVFSTTGKSSRELCHLHDHHQNLYMVGSMGIVSSTALGFSLATSKNVIVVDGDGSALMHLGALATIGTYAQDNFVHLVLDNGTHDSTGGQPTVSNNVDFAMIAHACGYAYATTVTSKKILIDAYEAAKNAPGPSLIQILITPGSLDPLPRPSFSPEENLNRFGTALKASRTK